MPNDIIIKDFSGGWMPCDDPISGRKNGLLKMDNMELDSNGALSLHGGTSVVNDYSGLAGIGNAHTLFSRLIDGARHDYMADSNGNVWKDTTNLTTGGDSTNAAFGTAFNYTLIASGSKRLKDSGVATNNLGILQPTVAPTVGLTNSQPKVEIGDLITHVVGLGSTSVAYGSYSIALTNNMPIPAAAQTYSAGGGIGPFDSTKFTGGGISTEDDFITIAGSIQYDTSKDLARSLEIRVLLTPGDASGDAVSDYFTYTLPDLRLLGANAIIGAGPRANLAFSFQVARHQFTRVGNGSQSWESIYGFTINYHMPYFTFFTPTISETITIYGYNPTSNSKLYIVGGSQSQNGSYQYAQLNVNNTGSYIAKSVLGPLSAVISPNLSQVLITPQDPTVVDPQCNEAWIYRKGGNLDQWYRVLVFNATTGFVTPTADTLGDQDALTLDITLNLNLVSINSLSITDKIFDIIGPVNGRWYYFTTNFMYPSDINNPDLVDASLAVRTCGNSSELFLWARLVNNSVILVGTSIDLYQLSGTFQTLPDNSIDVYYLPLGCKYPPVTCDCDTYGGSSFYLANDGWRVLNGSGQAAFTGNNNNTLVSPNLDRLYRGETVSGYEPPPIQQMLPRSARFPVCVAKNKLWCFITGIVTPRIEVYDFIRQYWRPVNYNLGDVSAVCRTQSGQLFAFYVNDKKLRLIDSQSSKLIDGVAKQSPNILTMVFDGDTPRQRKDNSNFKTRMLNPDPISVQLATELVSLTNIGVVPINIKSIDTIIDPPNIIDPGKTYQVAVNSSPTSDLVVNDFVISPSDIYPAPTLSQKFPVTNFDNASKKRIRTWPFVLSSPTGANQVSFTPSVDNVGQPTQIFTVGLERQTFRYYFKTDVFGVDYGGLLSSAQPFEVSAILQPEVVQVLPVAKQFDQIGPEELFRFGKIMQIELRVLPFGPSIPYAIYFNDLSVQNGSFSVISGIDASYFIKQVKGTAGNILRVTLGPTDFDFHRFYMRFLVAASGKDTGETWIQI